MSKSRVLVVVSSCPSTESKRWAPSKNETCEVCARSLLVKIVPETGRTSPVFRLEDEMAAYTHGEGNPYSLYGKLVEAFMGVSCYSLSITVARNVSGNLWEWWNGRRTGADILKRSKFNGYHGQRAFTVYDKGEEIDTVFYSRSDNVDCEEVRRALIDHDGYAPSITVEEEV